MKISSIYKTLIKTVIKSGFGIAKTTPTMIKNCFDIIQRVFLRAGDRPNAKAFGASGSQVSPDFSARPAGPKPFLVYRKYTLPLRNSYRGRFWYTRQYTAYISNCLTAH
jgi:hypothetical protein